MFEEDVNVESSTTEEVVEETTDQSQGVESSQESTETTRAEGVTSVESDVDEMNVPYKNRYMEMKRKNEGLETKMSDLTDAVKGLQTQQGQAKYTKSQLAEFIANPETDPAHRTWAVTEIEKLDEDRFSKVVRDEIQSMQTKQDAEKMKTQSFDYVTQRHPEIAIKDNAGNFVGWNTKSQLFQRMDMYMRNPEIANNPQGLRVALALANEDLSGVQAANQQRLKTQVKTLQKGTMTEGGGVAAAQTGDDLTKAKGALRKSGKFKEANKAVGAWLKKQGKIEE